MCKAELCNFSVRATCRGGNGVNDFNTYVTGTRSEAKCDYGDDSYDTYLILRNWYKNYVKTNDFCTVTSESDIVVTYKYFNSSSDALTDKNTNYTNCDKEKYKYSCNALDEQITF